MAYRMKPAGFSAELTRALARYLLAVVSSGLALGLSVAMGPQLNRTVFIWFFGAVTVSARFGGLGPGLLAAVLGVLAADYVLLPPFQAFELSNPTDLAAIVIFGTLSIAISTLTEQMRRARRYAEDHVIRAERAARRDSLLASASNILEESLNPEAGLSRLVHLIMANLADYAQIYLIDGERLRRAAYACRITESMAAIEELERAYPLRLEDQGPPSQVARTGQPILIPRVDAAMINRATDDPAHRDVVRRIGIRTMLFAPLTARGKTNGVLLYARILPGPSYTEDDLDLATELARRAALAVDNARLYHEAVRARQEAQAANEAKRDFLAAMSHELRTPLNAIAGYAELLEMGIHGEVSDQQREAIARIQRSQRHLQMLVEQVLSFAKAEAGKLTLTQSDVPVHPAIVHASEMIAPQVEAKRLVYEYRACDPALTAFADQDSVEQIIINLLANAVKYTGDAGRISVDVESDEQCVRIRISDTGFGIPSDRLETIFEPFVQLDSAPSKRKAGVGLGLAISRDLARAMRGDVEVISEVGAGSTFTLRLPRVAVA